MNILLNGSEFFKQYYCEGTPITYKKRHELPEGDFLFPKTRSFPIVNRGSITDALSSFGRSKSGLTYEEFVHKLYNFVKRNHPGWLNEFPESTLEKAGINKKSEDSK